VAVLQLALSPGGSPARTSHGGRARRAAAAAATAPSAAGGGNSDGAAAVTAQHLDTTLSLQTVRLRRVRSLLALLATELAAHRRRQGLPPTAGAVTDDVVGLRLGGGGGGGGAAGRPLAVPARRRSVGGVAPFSDEDPYRRRSSPRARFATSWRFEGDILWRLS